MTVVRNRVSASTAVNIKTKKLNKREKKKKQQILTLSSQHSSEARPSDPLQPPQVGFNKARGAADTLEPPQRGRTHNCIAANVAR